MLTGIERRLEMRCTHAIFILVQSHARLHVPFRVDPQLNYTYTHFILVLRESGSVGRSVGECVYCVFAHCNKQISQPTTALCSSPVSKLIAQLMRCLTRCTFHPRLYIELKRLLLKRQWHQTIKIGVKEKKRLEIKWTTYNIFSSKKKIWFCW